MIIFFNLRKLRNYTNNVLHDVNVSKLRQLNIHEEVYILEEVGHSKNRNKSNMSRFWNHNSKIHICPISHS